MREEAWQHLRECAMSNASDKSKLPSNFDAPIPPVEIADISLLEDDYSLEGDEQMSMEGPSINLEDHMEDGDEHVEMQTFPQRGGGLAGVTGQGGAAGPGGRAEHVRRKSVIPISADVMRELAGHRSLDDLAPPTNSSNDYSEGQGR